MQAADRFRWLSQILSPRPRPPASLHVLFSSYGPRRPFSCSPALAAKKRNAMPPKKAAAQEKKTLLGRPGNNLKIGIVGMFQLFHPPHCFPTSHLPGVPNVGKSSFFNTLSKTGQYASTHPQNLRPHIPYRPWKGCQLPLRHDQP